MTLAKRSIAYGAVVDNLKKNRYLQAFLMSLKYPSFYSQMPKRLINYMRRWT